MIFIHDDKYWEQSVFENHDSGKNKLKLIFVLSGLPGVSYFSRWTQGKKIAQSFLFTTKITTKYSSERFLCICGQKMSKGFLNLILFLVRGVVSCITSRINYVRPVRKPEKKHIKDNNCSGLPVEMLHLKAIKWRQNHLRVFNHLTPQARASE